MPEILIQNGDFVGDPAVAAASVLHDCLAVDEELLGTYFLKVSSEIPYDFEFCRDPSLRCGEYVSMLLLARLISRCQIVKFYANNCLAVSFFCV